MIGAPLHPDERERLDQTLRPAWESLGAPGGKNVWAEGCAMSLEKAIQFSLEEPGAAIAR
jgi:hypothetical protein